METSQDVVRRYYPDAKCTPSPFTGTGYIVISEGWWPGCIGQGMTTAKAWRDAAENAEGRERLKRGEA